MANNKSKELLVKKDLYAFLGVEDSATEKQIVKGYRKKALKCHPDKNPDNPKAAEEFHELSLALEILTDAAAKAAYDHSRKAKKEVEARNQVLDSKRKKFKDDLEAREQAAETKTASNIAAEKRLQAEIERLREEGSRLLEEEQRRMNEILKAQTTTVASGKGLDSEENNDTPRMKLKWKAAKGDPANGGYGEKMLTDIFSCYGKISLILVSSKRNGSAIVEFEAGSVSADILDEVGLSVNPCSIVWLSGKPSVNSTTSTSTLGGNGFQSSSYNYNTPFVNTCFDSYDNSINSSSNSNTANNKNYTDSVNFISTSTSSSCGGANSNSNPAQLFSGLGGGKGTGGSVSSNLNSNSTFPFTNSSHSPSQQGKDLDSESADFENLVLRKMRQAEERKKLIEQMMKEDEGN